MNNLLKTIEKYKKLNLNDVVDYQKFNDFSITAHSTQIEGSTLSLEETALLLNEGITPKGKPLDHSLMVKDHHNAIHYIHQLAKSKLSITPNVIQQINALVMKSTGQSYNTPLGSVESSKGEYRKGSVFVQARYFPDQSKVPTLINKLCDSINSKLDKVQSIEDKLRLSYSAHFNLVSIHPFYDGNGRTSRLLMNLIQEYYQLPLSVVYKEDKIDYYNALEETRNTESLNPIVNFMSNQHNKFLENEIALHSKQTKKINKGNGMSFLF